jgi:hypothetical protein
MISGERALWRSVIIQALRDATNKRLRKERADARKWFRGESLNFELICHLADLDSEAVRQQFLRRMKMKKKPLETRRKK